MLSADRRSRVTDAFGAICGISARSSVQQGGELAGTAPLPWHVWTANLNHCRGVQQMSQGRQSTMTGPARHRRADVGRSETDAGRKRAAVEIVARHEAALKRTARRYSLDAEDADDAYQRALEIVLTKAPTTDLRELIRWTQTVTKHEELEVRHAREKLLGYQRAREGAEDPMALIPAASDGPDEQVERREDIARSREALQALKPA